MKAISTLQAVSRVPLRMSIREHSTHAQKNLLVRPQVVKASSHLGHTHHNCALCTKANAAAGSATTSATSTASTGSKLQTRSIDPNLSQLIENNREWAQRMHAQDGDFFNRLGRGQAPKVLYFGCADSRVPANEILGLHPGEVFVHRNIGNLVPVSDLNSLSVLEYAVEFLDVQHIIVTGHHDCGAIHASMRTQDHGLIENWIRNIRDVYRLHHKELDAIPDIDQRKRRLVELNVTEQCLNLFKTGVVQRKRMRVRKEGKSEFVYPRIHGFVFDPKDGILHKLPLNFKEETERYRHIYNLYEN